MNPLQPSDAFRKQRKNILKDLFRSVVSRLKKKTDKVATQLKARGDLIG